ncbi:MAG: YbjQ family protein [Pseudomonadales bacterium]|nr:YbjQ family protein [Pseudomonadales bacterium]
MESLIQLGIFVTLMVLGFIFGRRAESKHYKSIISREDRYRHILITNEKLPAPEFISHDSGMVTGNVVISVDYFKVVAAGLKSLVGGRLTAYESLLDRARREALLRMQENAEELGALAIINTKFETSRISGNAGKGLGSVEVLAYGTALTPRC